MSYDVEKLDEVIKDFNKDYMFGGKTVRDFNFVPNVGFKINFYKSTSLVYSSRKEDLIPNYFETDVKPMFLGLRKFLRFDEGCKASIRALEDMDRGEEKDTYQVRVVDALVSRFVDWYAVDFKNSMLFESAVFKQWLVDNVVGVVDGFDTVEDIGIVDVVFNNHVQYVRRFAENFFNNFFNMRVEIGEEFNDEGVFEDCRDTLWWKNLFCGELFFDKDLSIDEFNTMFSPDKFVLYCNNIELRRMTLSTRREDLIRVQQKSEEYVKETVEEYGRSLSRLGNSTNYLAGWKVFVFNDFVGGSVVDEAIKVSERLIDSRIKNENEFIRNKAIRSVFSVGNLIAHRDTIRNSEDFNEQLREFQEERLKTINEIMLLTDEEREDLSRYRLQMVEYGITHEDLRS